MIIFRAIIYILAIPFVLIALLFTVNLVDVPLKDETEQFANSIQRPEDVDNGFHAIIGLNAPRNMGNIWKYGYDRSKLARGVSAKALISNVAGLPFIGDDLPEIPEENYEGREGFIPLEYVISDDDGKAIRCVVRPGRDIDECDAADAAAAVERSLRENKQITDRYRELYKYDRFYADAFQPFYSGRDFIHISQLINAKLVLDARAGREVNMQEWMAGMRFTQAALDDYSHLIAKSIFLVSIGSYLKSLEEILEARPEIAVKYRDELNEILSTHSKYGVLNIEKTMKMEIGMMDIAADGFDQIPLYYRVFYKKNATKNLFYEFAADLISVASSDYPHLYENLEEMERYHFSDMKYHDFIYNPMGKLFVSGIAAGSDLTATSIVRSVKMRALRLYVNAVAQGIKAKDAASHIASQPKELQNPFTEQPFEWDDEKKAIYLVHPEMEDYRILEIKWR